MPSNSYQLTFVCDNVQHRYPVQCDSVPQPQDFIHITNDAGEFKLKVEYITHTVKHSVLNGADVTSCVEVICACHFASLRKKK